MLVTSTYLPQFIEICCRGEASRLKSLSVFLGGFHGHEWQRCAVNRRSTISYLKLSSVWIILDEQLSGGPTCTIATLLFMHAQTIRI
jgi:hypothetical protein